MEKIYVVIPNWNGAEDLPKAVNSVLAQSVTSLRLIIVDNGSTDGSRQVIEHYCRQDRRISVIWQTKNYGYTGGVNPGFKQAIKDGANHVAAFNNDAKADKNWLKNLVSFLDTHPEHGIATCKLLHTNGNTIDSTGEQYSVWGLPYPRGRDEPAGTQYDSKTGIFAASGGASLYRVKMLEQIGLFDQDFFAYYEDVDLSFRAQLAGWKVAYVPEAIAYHEQGTTSNRMRRGFTTKQYMTNVPLVLIKNVPKGLFHRVALRLWLAYTLAFWSAVFTKGTGWAAIRGNLRFWWLLPKKIGERQTVQDAKLVNNSYVWEHFTHDLPPNARKLRQLRAFFWRLTGKKV